MRHTTSHDTWLSREPEPDPDVEVENIRDSIVAEVTELIDSPDDHQALLLELKRLTDALAAAEASA